MKLKTQIAEVLVAVAVVGCLHTFDAIAAAAEVDPSDIKVRMEAVQDREEIVERFLNAQDRADRRSRQFFSRNKLNSKASDEFYLLILYTDYVYRECFYGTANIIRYKDISDKGPEWFKDNLKSSGEDDDDQDGWSSSDSDSESEEEAPLSEMDKAMIRLAYIVRDLVGRANGKELILGEWKTLDTEGSFLVEKLIGERFSLYTEVITEAIVCVDSNI